MKMKPPRIAATQQELIPIFTCHNISQPGKILRTEIAPSWLLKAAKREPPNKLLKTKVTIKKDVINEGTSQ
jgi:hypothetical protein